MRLLFRYITLKQYKDDVFYHQNSQGEWIDFDDWVRQIVRDELKKHEM